MLLFRSFLALVPFLQLLCTTVVATPAPAPGRGHRGPEECCLTDDEANFLVGIMVSVSVKFDPNYVAQFFSDDFFVQSDSINFFFALPPGAHTSPSKAVFLSASYNLTSSGPQPEIDVVQTIHTCKQIAFRWRSQTKPYSLGGIDFMETVKTGDTWQIAIDYSEFNVGADLVDAGLFPCKTS